MKNKSEKFKNNLNDRSYVFAVNIIKFIDNLDKKDFSIEIISKQLLRSATSIGANIIEAQAGRTRKDFTNFFTHALKSSNETKFWLCLLRDSKKISDEQSKILLQEIIEISNILGSSILTLKGRK